MSFAAAFLDRDGTINVKAPEGDYITAPERVRLLPGAAEAIRALNAASVPVLVVTNQRGIALGRMSEQDLTEVHGRLDALLDEAGARVDGYYHCPHAEGVCDCRKPATGLLERAAAEHGLDLRRTLLVGDSATDVEAGRRVGATTVLLAADGAPQAADHVARSLLDAVRWALDR